MHQNNYMDNQDDPLCIWMSLMSIVAEVVSLSFMHQEIYMDAQDELY